MCCALKKKNEKSSQNSNKMCRTKKVADCNACVNWACNCDTMAWSIKKTHSCHQGHPIAQCLPVTLGKKLKEDLKRRVNNDRQSTSSVLLAYEREHDLKLQSKQV